jgi:SAM-dependent methyltransferase
MNDGALDTYYRGFAERYFGADIFCEYPETKVIPAYLRKHFADARLVLDLGFGTGLWFWASFLPALQRLDGIDSDREALEAADRLFEFGEVPEGFRAAHEAAGSAFGPEDLKRLKGVRGRFVFQDYLQPWPPAIADQRYDLVTEHGGGFGQMDSDAQFRAAVARAGSVLRPGGRLMFANFAMRHSALEKQVGKAPSPAFHLRGELFVDAVARAGMRMVDFHVLPEPTDMPDVHTFFYGYAQK